jgi:hypothetical protein
VWIFHIPTGRGAQQFSRLYVEIDGRDNFNAVPIGLDVKLFDRLGANDGLAHEMKLQKV